MLAALMNPPQGTDQWNRWSFDHRDSHDRIRAAIKAQLGVTLQDYIIDPISGNDLQGFLERNSQLHIDMNGVLNLSSNDLQDVNLNDKRQLDAWIEIHTLEHQDAEERLGI